MSGHFGGLATRKADIMQIKSSEVARRLDVTRRHASRLILSKDPRAIRLSAAFIQEFERDRQRQAIERHGSADRRGPSVEQTHDQPVRADAALKIRLPQPSDDGFEALRLSPTGLLTSVSEQS